MDPHDEPARRPASPTTTALLAGGIIGGCFVLGFGYLFYLAPDMGDSVMSGSGIFAMVLGIVFTLAVGIGLMGLVFYSNRHGYDDSVARLDTRADRNDGRGEIR